MILKSTKEKLLFSGILAGIVTGIHVLHKKFGGLLSAGRYSDSHSWQDIIEMIPQFVGIFFVFFVGAFIYFDYKSNK